MIFETHVTKNTLTFQQKHENRTKGPFIKNTRIGPKSSDTEKTTIDKVSSMLWHFSKFVLRGMIFVKVIEYMHIL